MNKTELLIYARTLNIMCIFRKGSVINDLIQDNILTDPICDDPNFLRLGLHMKYVETDLYGHKSYKLKLHDGWHWEYSSALDAMQLNNRDGDIVYQYNFPSYTYKN